QKTAAGSPRRSSVWRRCDGSELVTQGQQHRPARHQPGRIARVRVVDTGVLPGGSLLRAQVVVVAPVRGSRVHDDIAVAATGTSQASQVTGVEATDLLGVTPVLVEQIEEVVDVQPDNRLVVFEEARQLLLDTQVKLVHPRQTGLV